MRTTLRRSGALAALVFSLAAGPAVAQTQSQPAGPAAVTQSPVPSSNKFAVQYGYCFTDGQNFVYDQKKAKGVEDCRQRCEDDVRCNVFEIWEHTLICKLYSRLPKQAPKPQSVFPQNKTARGEQAQAAIGVKIVRGF